MSAVCVLIASTSRESTDMLCSYFTGVWPMNLYLIENLSKVFHGHKSYVIEILMTSITNIHTSFCCRNAPFLTWLSNLA